MVYPTRAASHEAYKEYVNNHIRFVQKAFNYKDHMIARYFCKAFGIKLEDSFISKMIPIIQDHDMSKFSDEEFSAYAAKFYPCNDDKGFEDSIKEEFEKAWKHHYMNNSHHPEWYYYRFGKKTSNYSIKNQDIIEMVCDWCAMSMNFKQSLYLWWKNEGRDEKDHLIPAAIIKYIDQFMEDNKEAIDFREYDDK